MWINAIGREGFQPTKNHLICNAHFKTEDYMDRPNTSGVRLKNLAVPSIFSKVSASAFIPNITGCITSFTRCKFACKNLEEYIKETRY